MRCSLRRMFLQHSLWRQFLRLGQHDIRGLHHAYWGSDVAGIRPRHSRDNLLLGGIALPLLLTLVAVPHEGVREGAVCHLLSCRATVREAAEGEEARVLCEETTAEAEGTEQTHDEDHRQRPHHEQQRRDALVRSERHLVTTTAH